MPPKETQPINNNPNPQGQEGWEHLPYEQLTPEQQSKFNEMKDKYYGLLSVLVLRKWDNCSSIGNDETPPYRESDGEGDGHCSIL